LLDVYVQVGAKKMRCGYTTGTCAAIASRAAVEMLFGGIDVERASLLTPKGIEVTVDILDIQRGEDWVSCGVAKDGGDDIDATNGMVIYARAEKSEVPGITLDGGIGIGRVTKPGLAVAVGEAAINPVPRQMITSEVLSALKRYEGAQGVAVSIYAPQGEEVARHTFNPNLGIVGGISILGTSGIVEPMSQAALIETIRIETRMKRALGRSYLIGAPGNYGTMYAQSGLAVPAEETVKFSNFAGEMIDIAASEGFRGLLLIGHFGKFVKLAGGGMNTHSRVADCRMQIIAAEAALKGGSQIVAKKIMAAATVDEAIDALIKNDLKEAVMAALMERIADHVHRRAEGRIAVEAITFTNRYGLLAESPGAREMLCMALDEMKEVELCEES